VNESVLRAPANLSRHAEACLRSVAGRDLGGKISIGGARGLQHYLEYRETHDVDSRWVEAGAGDRREVLDAVTKTLQQFGDVKTRVWGDVVSIEFAAIGKDRLQFSGRPPVRTTGYTRACSLDEVLLDGLTWWRPKLVALLERGAPRDFQDIFTMCGDALLSVQQRWELWKKL
jgi:hypothetical protein